MHNGNGSAAYCSPIRHPLSWWSAPYPETTGYIIETLIKYDSIFPELDLKKWAISCADWLVDIQFENGSYPTLLKLDNPPSIFNTGQIVFGLADAYELTNDTKYEVALRLAIQWLIDELDEQGNWPNHHYKEGYAPSYLSRVTWSVLRGNELLQNPSFKAAGKRSLNYLKPKNRSNASITDWGFERGKSAFTHTIAYTYRGFLEAGLLLYDEDAINIATKGIDKLLHFQNLNGQLAGSYDNEWRPNQKFKCITGHSQVAILCNRLFEVTNDELYQSAAKNILVEIEATPSQLPLKSLKGALPGSSPFFGPYMSFKYPNWAAKFFLDAIFPFI